MLGREKQRELAAMVIAKMEVWSHQSGGRGTTHHVERGVVHLRPDMRLAPDEADNLLSTTRSPIS